MLVKTTSKKDITLFKLKSSDSFKNLKALNMIQFKEGVSGEQQTLVYNGKVQHQDDKTLATSNVDSWSADHAVFWVLKKSIPRWIWCEYAAQVPGWGPILMEVKPWHIGREMKALMESMVGFDLDDYVVSHGEKLIKDSMSISECNTNKDSPLT
ncbi:polyubiquitin-B-like [Prunus yedoensis var. nudiflora]|uniref:Polyubiquitin-B-like n=1 Tax=Prunus yedoensis var. nudiflora TaxID=2094558 RepID=A0A314UQ96_PRUYE|nr:polyubiquitin-B-like [Prunus yedoensis var. nudiflora]